MEHSFREIKPEEITNVKRILVSNLFIISKGLLYSKKVLLYYLRCYSYQSGILETVLQSNKIPASIQAETFLQRLGFINNTLEKSLTIVYERPERGEIMTIDGFIDQEMDKGRKISLLNDMFGIVAHIKKTRSSIEVGCLYPHLFFSFYDLEKPLLMVDYIFSSLFQSSKNSSLRLLNGYFNSINCDEILMSCILLCYGFMDVTQKAPSLIQLIHKVNSSLTQEAEAQADQLCKNIDMPLIKEFILNIFTHKPEMNYLRFYSKFKKLHLKLKELIPKADLKINERFFKIMGETKERMEKIGKAKAELEFFFKNMPKVAEMSYSREIQQSYFNDASKLLEGKNKKKAEIAPIALEYKEFLSSYENKMKEYLMYKLEKIKANPNESEDRVNKLQTKIDELKLHISMINDFNTDSSLLINLENDGNEFMKRLKIFKTQILPRLFDEYIKVIEQFPQTFNQANNIDFLCLKPQYSTIRPNYYPLIKEGSKVLEVFQHEKDSKNSLQQIKLEFDCEFKGSETTVTNFPKNCEWLTFSSFVIVNGGENTAGESLSYTMIIDLTHKDSLSVYPKKDMQFPKKHHSLCKYNSFYMISLGGDSKSAEVYSILGDSWEKLPDLHSNRENGVLCLFNDSDLYYFGGKEASNAIEHLQMKEKIEDINETGWELIELKNKVTFSHRAYIKRDKPYIHKLLILGGSIDKPSSEEDYNSFIVDFNNKKVEEYKTKLTLNLTYVFPETEMTLIDNAYVQVGVDENKEGVLVSFAKSLFIVD